MIGNNALATTTLLANGAGTLTLTYVTYSGTFSLANPSTATYYADQGQTVIITDSGATGGYGPPYNYQWLEKAPGAGGYTNSVDCALPTTTTCTFVTSTGSTSGTYSFEFKAGDEGSPPSTKTGE